MEPTSDKARSREEAALWAARLEGGDMGDADRTALGAWLRQSPENVEELTRLRDASARASPKLPAIFEQIDLRQTRRRKRAGRRGAAFTVVGGIAAGVIWCAVRLFSGQHFETGAAERRVILLRDGSRVTLSARTELRVNFSGSERRVVLKHGEALFSVSKDASRAFYVQVPAGLVRVTGTVFDVHTHAAQATEVTVVEGHVEVRSNRNSESRTLDPDTRGRLEEGSVKVDLLAPGEAEQSISWQEGRVIFQDTRLEDAVRRFAEYHGWEITVSPSAADFRLGGRYDLDNVQEFIRALPRVLPVTVRQNGRRAEIESRPAGGT